jgi:DNA-binding winged helix-turn-helix (wHTH) protein/tetratricopeptide (TPR) repeat protein
MAWTEVMETERIQLGSYSFDPVTLLLHRNGDRVTLPRKAMELLAVLAADVNALVPRERIFDALWPDGFVHEGNLTQTIYLLRKSLAADSAVSIENVPGRGYRLHVGKNGRHPRQRHGWSIGVLRFSAVSMAVLLCAGSWVGLRLAGTHAPPLTVRDDFVVAMYHFDRFVDLRLARTYFERTTRRAPNVPEGYAGAALIDAIKGYDSPGRAQYCARGRSGVARANALGSSALARTAEAMLYVTCERSLQRARRELDAALAMDPSNPTALAFRARVALWENRAGEAISFASEAAANDPTSPEAVLVLGIADYYAGDLRSSARTFERLLELMPNRPVGLDYLERSYEGLGDFSKAEEILHQAEREPANVRWVWAARARLLARRGERRESLAVLRARASESDPESLAAAYAAAGDRKAAIRNLKIAESRHSLNTQIAWLGDFRFASLRREFSGLSPAFVTWR